MSIVVGVDFGASRLKVGIAFQNETPQVLQFADGRDFVPSVFFCPPGTELVFFGERAESMLFGGGKTVLHDLKPSIAYPDVTVGTRSIRPEDLLRTAFSVVLNRIRSEFDLSAEVPVSAVVTLPWKLRNQGGDAIIERAALAAGFSDVRSEDEVIAAARWWFAGAGSDERPEGSHAVIVDVGSWTVDIALAERTADGTVETVLGARQSMTETGCGAVDRELMQLLHDRYIERVAEANEDAFEAEVRQEARVAWLEREARRLRDAASSGAATSDWATSHGTVWIEHHAVEIGLSDVEAKTRDHLVGPVGEALVAYLTGIGSRQEASAAPVVLCGGGAAALGLKEGLRGLCASSQRAVHVVARPEHAVALGGAIIEMKAGSSVKIRNQRYRSRIRQKMFED